MGQKNWGQFQIRNLTIGILTLFMFILFRFEFLYWNWEQFKMTPVLDLAEAFLLGLRFDLSSTAYLLLPLFVVSVSSFWFRWTWKAHFILSLVWIIPWLLLDFIDIEFINFGGRRWTQSGLFIWSEAQGKWSGFLLTYAPWILIGCVQFFAWARAIDKLRLKLESWLNKKMNSENSTSTAMKMKLFLFGCVGLLLLIVAARGGLQKKPITPIHANVFTAPVLNNLTLNSTFTLMKSFGRTTLPRVKYFEDHDEMLKLLNGSAKSVSLDGLRPMGPQNVVIIIMESFGLEYTGIANNGKGYTPFFDQLTQKAGALFFKNGFANGRRSIEGIAAILAGVPALMSEPFISSEFATNKFMGLGSFLQTQNRSSSFFHGGGNGTMYFDSFTKSAGIQKYVGLNEYPEKSKDFDGTWGIYDRPFFHYFLDQLNQAQKPMTSVIFSLSSHHPYKIPDSERPNFPEGPVEILSSIAYADDVLKDFFAKAEKQPWFKDTLFVITADHTQKNYLPSYENEISKYKIPVLFYHAGMKWPAIDKDQIVQQIDILPSVLDFLNVSVKEQILLGSSVFNNQNDKVSLHFNEGRYLLVAKDYFLDWKDGHEPEMYSRNDEFQKNILSEPTLRREELISKMKAGIQYFSEGLWDNKLYFPNLPK